MKKLLARLLSAIRSPAALPRSIASPRTEEAQWLEAVDNPFGVRILDCETFARTTASTTKDVRAIEWFGSEQARSGTHFIGLHPTEAVLVPCSLAYPLASPLLEGPLFIASSMEEKWNAYLFGPSLYFARSWSGQLCYLAECHLSESELRISAIEAWPGSVLGPPELAIAQVDFLIKSHVFDCLAVHPLPDFLRSISTMALWSFQQYGNRGLYGSCGATTKLPALARPGVGA